MNLHRTSPTSRPAAVAILLTTALALALNACSDAGGGSQSDPEPDAVRDMYPTFTNPLPVTKVGDWVRYELENGHEQLWEVVEANPLAHTRRVRVEQRDPDTGKLILSEVRNLNSNEIFLWGVTAGTRFARVTFEHIEEMGREFETLAVVNAGGIPGVVQSFYSSDVPILGLVRRTSLGKGGTGARTEEERVVLRLVSMGRAE